MDLLNLIVAVSTCIFSSVLSVIIAIWVMRHDNKIAEISGAYRKPKLSVSLFGQPIDNLQYQNREWILIHPGKEHEWAFYPLRFNITNAGDATAENLVLVIYGPDFIFPNFPEEIIKTDVGLGAFQESFGRHVSSVGENKHQYKNISYSLPPIHPKTSFSITDWFSFTPLALIPLSVDAKTKDGSRVRIKTKYTVGVHMAVTLLVKDSPPIQSAVSVSCLASPSIDEGISAFASDIQEDYRNVVASLSLYKKIIYALSRFWRVVFINFLAFEPDQTVRNKKKTVHILKTEEKAPFILKRLRIRGNWRSNF